MVRIAHSLGERWREVRSEHVGCCLPHLVERSDDKDDVARARGMSAHERMLHHRTYSLPEMKRLKKMCSDKLQSKLVEPNAPLWEPVTFIIDQWGRLTKFCGVPGIRAPRGASPDSRHALKPGGRSFGR